MQARKEMYFMFLQNVTRDLIESQVSRGVNRAIIDSVDSLCVSEYDKELENKEKDSFMICMLDPMAVCELAEKESKALNFAKAYFHERCYSIDSTSEINYLLNYYGDKGIELNNLGKLIDSQVFAKYPVVQVSNYLD